MAAALEHLAHELSGVRTGRANPGLLENIPVDAHGERVPLKAVGAVTVRNPQLLVVTLFDAGVRRPRRPAVVLETCIVSSAGSARWVASSGGASHAPRPRPRPPPSWCRRW